MPLFTPEEKKIFNQEVGSIKQGMLTNKRALVSKYGKDAEKVIQGNAVKKALKKIKNLRQNQEMENNKLKEMVKNALTKPLKEQDVEVRADRIGGEMELSKMMNLLDEFESALESHDWYYMMSDDNRAYKKGSTELAELKGIAKQLSSSGYKGEAEELYNKYNVFDITFDSFISPSEEFIPGYKRKQMGLDEKKAKPDFLDLDKDGNKKESMKKAAQDKKKMQTEDMDLGHEDDEPHMLKADLYHIGKYAMNLYQMIDQFESKGEVDFPHWWQSKIIKAKEMMSSAKHYLDFELKEPQIDAMAGVGDMMNEEINQNNLQGELTQAFSRINPKVSVYGNNGEVKFEIDDDVNQNTFNSVINYLEGNNFVVDRKRSYPDYDTDDDRKWFPRIRFTIKGPNTGNSLSNLNEKTLTKPEMKKKEKIVKAMKKDFKGPKTAMYAIATEKAKKVAEIMAKELKDNTSK